jgi:Tfp pilus tip-associated adhesin PilY1
VDIDRNGYVDRVYIGDLDGRVWKVDVTPEFENAGSWDAEALYVDPDNYPIITKPAIWRNPAGVTADPRIFFGTGGDDGAPIDVTYSFVALIDRAASADIEWYLGVPYGIRSAERDAGNLTAGEKVWADPKIEDYTVYFSTLTGSIEAVDPCLNLAGLGKLYARFIVSIGGTPVGGTAFKGISGALESLDLAIKTRSAVTLGETQTTTDGARKREVYIQEYDSTVQKLEQLTGGLLKVKSWREVYKVFKR